MCFLFQGRDNPVETLHIGSANAMDDRAFQFGQMTLNAVSEFSPFCRWSHYKRAAICFTHCARD
jgi:hypothetical protein